MAVSGLNDFYASGVGLPARGRAALELQDDLPLLLLSAVAQPLAALLPYGCGTPLTREELLALREKHPSSVYFSRELMAKYFTYSEGNGTHFVLFDDAETLRQKVKLAQNLGIQTAFLMFPEISDLLPEL